MNQVSIREVKEEDVRSCHQIEFLCFEPSEAATLEKIRCRQQQYPEGFLVAELENEIVGFINSGATNEPDLSDEEFKDLIGHDPEGKNLVIFSVAIKPDYQKAGISRRLMEVFLKRAKTQNKKEVFLLCKAHLITYYEKLGFRNAGESKSDHGGFSWKEMRQKLNGQI